MTSNRRLTIYDVNVGSHTAVICGKISECRVLEQLENRAPVRCAHDQPHPVGLGDQSCLTVPCGLAGKKGLDALCVEVQEEKNGSL